MRESQIPLLILQSDSRGGTNISEVLQEREVTSFTVLRSLHFSVSSQAYEIGNPCKEGKGPFLLFSPPSLFPSGRRCGEGGVCVYKCVSCVDIVSSGRDKVKKVKMDVVYQSYKVMKRKITISPLI